MFWAIGDWFVEVWLMGGVADEGVALEGGFGWCLVVYGGGEVVFDLCVLYWLYLLVDEGSGYEM